MRSSILYLLLYLLVVTSGCSRDTVRLPNANITSSSPLTQPEAVLLVSGHVDGHPQRRLEFRTTTTVADVGEVSPVFQGYLDPSAQQVMVFQRGRALTINNLVPWTDEQDTVDVVQRDRVDIPVTVWIMMGKFNKQKKRALKGLTHVINRFHAESVGIGIGNIQFRDRTPGASFATVLNAEECSDLMSYGFDAGRMNIYYVNKAKSSYFTAFGCADQPVVAMGRHVIYEVLGHELGHTMGLAHVGSHQLSQIGAFSNVDQKNFMWPLANILKPHQYFTEGQIFRMHVGGGGVHNSSAMEHTFNELADDIVCPVFFSDSVCLQLDKRLFDDGNDYPAN